MIRNKCKLLTSILMLLIGFAFLGKNEVVNASAVYTSNESGGTVSGGPTTGS